MNELLITDASDASSFGGLGVSLDFKFLLVKLIQCGLLFSFHLFFASIAVVNLFDMA